MTRPPLALQLHSLSSAFDTDPVTALERVPRLGFRYIETAGDYGWSATEWQRHLTNTGLQILAAHCTLPDLERDPDRLLDFHGALGHRTLVLSRLPIGTHPDEDTSMAAADRLMQIANHLHHHHFRLVIHPHADEFQPLPEGGRCIDHLLAGTDPDRVGFEFDTFWLERAGEDAADWLHRHANRTTLLHAREYVAFDESETIAGLGNVRFHPILQLACLNEWPVIVVHHGGDAENALTESAAYYKRLISEILATESNPSQKF